MLLILDKTDDVNVIPPINANITAEKIPKIVIDSFCALSTFSTYSSNSYFVELSFASVSFNETFIFFPLTIYLLSIALT